MSQRAVVTSHPPRLEVGVRVLVSRELHQQLQQLAEREQRPLAQIARFALERYVADHRLPIEGTAA